jgi:hypothetical protein
VADSSLVGIQACQQRGAGRAAARHIIELRETHTARSERIEVWRRDLSAITANIGEADVVCQDDHDIRPVRRTGKQAEHKEQAKAGKVHGDGGRTDIGGLNAYEP